MFAGPLRSEVNTIHWPSAEYEASYSKFPPEARSRSLLPSELAMYSMPLDGPIRFTKIVFLAAACDPAAAKHNTNRNSAGAIDLRIIETSFFAATKRPARSGPLETVHFARRRSSII